MSQCMRKPTICIGENKGADQLRGNHKADQRLCFRYTDSTVPLLLKSKVCIHLDNAQVYCVRENRMARICFSILFPLCSFTICHSCILNMEISVKHFSGTARHRMMKFGTNIGYDKLYCVRKNQPSLAYQSLYLSIFLSLLLKFLSQISQLLFMSASSKFVYI